MSSAPKKKLGLKKQEQAHDSDEQPTPIDQDEHFRITNITGDLTIDPPDNAILIHSVNCLGQWGSGVALALANALPGAYKVYQDYCKQHSVDELLGCAFLAPPQKGDYDLAPGSKGSTPGKPRRWVYCLFVSEGYGRATKTKPGKAKPADIIKHTRKALEEVRGVLFMGQQGKTTEWGSEVDEHGQEEDLNLKEVWACKFNSGSFGVEWETTLGIIKDVFEGRNGDVWKGEMKVVSRA